MEYEIKEGSYVTYRDGTINNGNRIKVLAILEDSCILFRLSGQFWKEKLEKLQFYGNEPQFSF